MAVKYLPTSYIVRSQSTYLYHRGDDVPVINLCWGVDSLSLGMRGRQLMIPTYEMTRP